MSQAGKRTAEEAFNESSTKSESRKRHRRRHRAQSSHKPGPESPIESKSIVAVNPEPTSTSSEVAVVPSIENQVSVKKKHKKSHQKKQHVDKTVIRQENKSHDSWTLSPSTGGVFIDHDPIITADGKFLILPVKDQIQVYSVSTSLLVRSVKIRDKHTISSCSLSVTDPGTILVVTNEGMLTKFNLKTGSKLGHWKVEPGITAIRPLGGNASPEQILAICRKSGEDDELILMSIQTGSKVVAKILHRKSYLQNRIGASSDGSIVVAFSAKTVYIGLKGSDSKYTWYTFRAPGLIVSFDVRFRQQENAPTKTSTVDLVLGLDSGALHIYQDVLSKLIRQAKSGQKIDTNGRKLHWHRSAARSVKWSKDGNYLISGGDETVLVIWQLETNQQQYLPHLSTSILNITVSSSGAQYVLRLGDNSAMILSTADLLPMTNVSGLSLPSQQNEQYPMLLHPMHSNMLLAAVPIRPSKNDLQLAATHLQTYDIDTSLQLNRQALTRNLTTIVNVSPEGYPLQEPGITHMQISFDGLWMTTVESWSPLESDMRAMHLAADQLAREKETETILRFWRWNEENKSWDIVMRIEEPHAPGVKSVLALASNPDSPEFSTMGADGSVKVWQPRKRVRDGIQVRDRGGKPLFTWTCARSIQVDRPEVDAKSGALAYSEDGSIITASWSGKQRQVHVLDPSSGRICMSLPHLLDEGPATLKVVGRHLLCLSSNLRVVDMITLQTVFVAGLKGKGTAMLKANARSNSVAIAVNIEDAELASISIFDLGNLDQGSVDEIQLSSHLHALLAEPSGKGFVVVDRDCEIRVLAAPRSIATSSLALARPTLAHEEISIKALEDVFGRHTMEVKPEQQKLIENGDTSRTLIDILASTSTAAQPGVNELFDMVSKAVAGVQLQVGA